MDTKFHEALAAVHSGDLEQFRAALAADPSLVTARSARSHPTLLQCAVLDGNGKPHNVEMVRLLVDAGASLDGQLVVAASVDNVPVADLLLERGAAVDGDGGWSPIEEALYWNSRDALALLLARGASVRNLRVAAGLGRTDAMATFFARDGELEPEAGKIEWPFGTPEAIEQSNHPEPIKRSLAERIRAWPQTRQAIVDNAFVYACMHGHVDAATLLLEKGAAIDAIPFGFDFAGTGLHYAALNGHRAMLELLLQRGADPSVRDAKIGAEPVGWARHAGRTEIVELLERAAKRSPPPSA
jgi:ankyrin repeat protein